MNDKQEKEKMHNWLQFVLNKSGVYAEFLVQKIKQSAKATSSKKPNHETPGKSSSAAAGSNKGKRGGQAKKRKMEISEEVNEYFENFLIMHENNFRMSKKLRNVQNFPMKTFLKSKFQFYLLVERYGLIN